VGADRVAAWLAGFDRRHSVLRTDYQPDLVRLEAADGALAACEPPFPPLPQPGEHAGLVAEPLVAHVLRHRVVGVLLVRLGGYAAGVFDGDRLLASRVGARLVHGRSAAGGRSQHRFARRRELQARQALEAAAENAASVLLPRLPDLDAVVLGGDRRAVDALRRDRRLEPVFALAVARFLTVPDPRLAVLTRTPAMFRALRVWVQGPPAGSAEEQESGPVAGP
jgi:Actinobacteria/chloroflexi VLRF1 release factor